MNPDTDPIRLPQATASGRRWGWLAPDGAWAIPPNYEMAFAFFGGLAVAVRDGRCGYLRPDGSVAVPFRFDEAHDFDEDGWADVAQDGVHRMIRPDGSFVPRLDSEEAFCSEADGIVSFWKNGRCGLADLSGDVVLAPEYDALWGIGLGLFGAERDGAEGILDAAGRVVAPFRFDDVAPADDHGWIRVIDGGSPVFLDAEGREVFDPCGEDSDTFQGDYLAVSRGGRWGAIDREGKTVVPFRWGHVAFAGHGLLSVSDPDCGDPTRDNLFVELSTGRPAFPERFAAIDPWLEGDDFWWCIAPGKGWGPWTREGRFLRPPAYSDPYGLSIGSYRSGELVVDGRCVPEWFDLAGRVLSPPTAAPSPADEPHSEPAEPEPHAESAGRAE